MGLWESIGNLVVDFRSTLAQVGPAVRVIGKAGLVSTLGGPNDTS